MLNSHPLRSQSSLVAQMVKNLSAVQETRFDPWVRRTPWRREWLPIQRIGFQSYFRGLWVTGGSKAILFPCPTQFKIMVKHVPWEAIFKNWLKTCYLIIFSVFTNVLYLMCVISEQTIPRKWPLQKTPKYYSFKYKHIHDRNWHVWDSIVW